MNMDISLDIHVKSEDYGYKYECEISHLRESSIHFRPGEWIRSSSEDETANVNFFTTRSYTYYKIQ